MINFRSGVTSNLSRINLTKLINLVKLIISETIIIVTN